MNEAEKRAELIDPALTAAGWGAVEDSGIRREFSIPLGRLEDRGLYAAGLVTGDEAELFSARYLYISAA